MKFLKHGVALLSLLVSGMGAFAQSASPLGVHYMVDYDAAQQTYTAWVVPQYSTPNRYNSDSEEKGATAQVTIKVPKGFKLTSLEDIRGNWDKTPGRIGSETPLLKAGANEQFAYYVIGKQAAETNYGVFKEGEPVALFRFKGTGTKPEDVTVLDTSDPFVEIANKSMSLNVSNSFYSRSGQQPSVSVRPLEQFAQPITLPKVLAQLAKKLQASIGSMTNELEEAAGLITYPNPAINDVNVKYFSQSDGGKVHIELIDPSGIVRYEAYETAKQGINTLKINVEKLSSGSYLIRTDKDNKIITKKFTKG